MRKIFCHCVEYIIMRKWFDLLYCVRYCYVLLKFYDCFIVEIDNRFYDDMAYFVLSEILQPVYFIDCLFCIYRYHASSRYLTLSCRRDIFLRGIKKYKDNENVLIIKIIIILYVTCFQRRHIQLHKADIFFF